LIWDFTIHAVLVALIVMPIPIWKGSLLTPPGMTQPAQSY
jgi:hypothetical protein